MAAHWVMMKREKEELISHEMHAKYWNLNNSKTANTVSILDLIVTLRTKWRKTDERKVDVHIDNKGKRKIINTSTRVTNHFNQDSTAEIKAIKEWMIEVDLEIMLIVEQDHRELI